MDYILFSIDDWYDPRTLFKFLRHIDIQKASSKMKGNMGVRIGGYEGKLELSFILREDDYLEHVAPFDFTTKQKEIMLIDNTSEMKTYILDPLYHSGVCVGNMSEYEGEPINGFTYNPNNNTWYVLENTVED